MIEALSALGVSKTFERPGRRPWDSPETVHALRDVSLVVHAGERVALMGRSGAGKTTMVRLLLGLEEPTAGELLVWGSRWSDLKGEALRSMRARVQYVPQDAVGALDPQQTVEEHVVETLRVLGLKSRQEAREQARELLNSLGLDHRRTALPRQLSGGEQRRVTLARVFALRPELVVADEPTSGLDAVRRKAVLDQLLGGLAADTACVVVTHDPEVALGWCTRAVVLLDGAIVEDLPLRGAFEAKHPYTSELFDPWGAS